MSRSLIPCLFEELQQLQQSFESDKVRAHKVGSASGLWLYEDDDKIYVKASVPGCGPDDVQIRFEKGILWIEAKAKHDLEGKKVHVRSHEEFAYNLPISSRLDDSVAPDALCKDGMLTVSFAKSKAARPQKIEVKGS